MEGHPDNPVCYRHNEETLLINACGKPQNVDIEYWKHSLTMYLIYFIIGKTNQEYIKVISGREGCLINSDDWRWTEQFVVANRTEKMNFYSYVSATGVTLGKCFYVSVQKCATVNRRSPRPLLVSQSPALWRSSPAPSLRCNRFLRSSRGAKLVWHKWCYEAFKSPEALLTVQKFDERLRCGWKIKGRWGSLNFGTVTKPRVPVQSQVLCDWMQVSSLQTYLDCMQNLYMLTAAISLSIS